MRGILMLCEVLCISGMIAGCDVSESALESSVVRDIGLPVSGAPPLGEGVAPSIGRGGDGTPVVVAIGGWSGGPGAVRWHGGQWVMPYAAHPGSTLQNVSCDVVPRADASALVELVSSNGQVLGSSTVPATTANVVIRSWPFVGSHAVLDGEQVLMRISPRDSVSGAWTSATQDMTIINCAARATAAAETHSITILPTLSYNPGTWGAIDRWTDSNGVTMIATTSLISAGSGRISIPHGDGDAISSVTVFVCGNGVSDASFQVERFNIGIAGGFATLGPIVTDSNRGNTWIALPVSVSALALSASDVVFLNMAPTPGADVGYHVGGVVVNFN